MLWNFLKEKMGKHLSKTVGENGSTMTYEELIIFSERIGEKLWGEKCCAIYCKSEFAAAIAVLGCFAANVTAVPLSPRYGEKHCRKILELVSPTCLITDDDGELKVHYISDYKYVTPEESPALIMCTSGTTGVPKGAMLSGKNIVTNVRDICRYFSIDETDTILISRPLYHAAVLTGEFLAALVKGVNIEFYSESFNPIEIIKIWKEKNITVFCGTPTSLSLMARFAGEGDTYAIKYVVVSGECMSAETGARLAKAFNRAKIYHVYGLTEACPRVSYLPPEYFSRYSDCVGVPLYSVGIKIADIYGNELKSGKKGVLWVRGDNIMMGYYNANSETKKIMKNGWLCTKDIASITKDGWLKIYGRSDDMIIRAGMNIYPAEIEAELKKDERTKEALVYGISDKSGTIQIALDISGDFKDKNEVCTICKSLLPAYQMPTVINLMESLPKNGSGKIIRKRNYKGVREDGS